MFTQQLVNGLMIGSVYALIAVGYTLVFGVLRLLNMAHGEVFMVAGVVGALASTRWGLSLPLALVLALGVSVAIGFLIHLLCFRFVNRTVEEAPLLATLGLGLIVTNLAAYETGSEPAVFKAAKLGISEFELFDMIVSPIDLLTLGLGAALMLVLTWLIHRTRIGRRIRAVADNLLAAKLMGISEARVTLFATVISALLAAAAGLLMGLRFGKVSPYIGMTVGLKGIGVMVLGGLGNVYGAMFGGLAVGIAESLASAYLGGAYADVILWVLLIATLMFRPHGLFVTEARRRA